MCDSATRPAFIPAPNTVRTRMVYSLDSQEVMNVFYFQFPAPATFSDLVNLNAEVEAAWTAQLKPQQPVELRLEYIESTALDADPGFQATHAVGSAGTNGTSPSLPSNVTLSISFKTGVTGRSNRGRMYWLQLAEGQVIENEVGVVFVSTLITKITAFFEAIETGTSSLHAVVSYCTGGAWRTEASVLPVEDYVIVDNVVDSQRRRLPGRGR